MPNVDQSAKAWELELSRRVGSAIKDRRNALKLTAVDLAERTKALGYPVNRVAISKIEGNLRAGKLDVAELLVLAVALEIPPALLLLPTFPDGAVEVLPGRNMSVTRAREWMCGDAPIRIKIQGDGIHGYVNRPNSGTGLVGAVTSRASLDANIANLRRLEQEPANGPDTVDSIRRARESFEERLTLVKTEIADAKAELWGNSTEDADG